MAVLIAGISFGQDFRAFRGNQGRTGRATAQTGQSLPETTWNNSGRAFLRWWDPATPTLIQTDNGPSANTSSTGTWTDPDPAGTTAPEFAGPFVQILGSSPIYLFATTVAGISKTDPRGGASAIYTFTLPSLDTTQKFEVDFSVPLGPTNTTPLGTSPTVKFQAKYTVVEVVDSTGSHVCLVDSAFGGNLVPLISTDGSQVYKPVGSGASGTITVNVYNTTPLAPSGNGFLDPNASPGNQLVYADAVQAEIKTTRSGAYTASPVVGILANNSPVTGTTDVFTQRVVHARNDVVYLGTNNQQYNVGVLTSSTHNGATSNSSDIGNLNRVWAWPAKRAEDTITGDQNRFANDVQTWLSGPNTTDSRNLVRRQVDDVNAECTLGGTAFVSHNDAGSAPFIGPDFLAAPVSPTATSAVTWSASKFPDGAYNVYVYIPAGTTGPTLTTQATYTVAEGPSTIATVNVNQNVNKGWVQIATGVTNPNGALSVSVADTGATGEPSTTLVAADAVRFVAQADWSINSTPVFVSTNINDGTSTTPHDVVVVASETGRLTCMDAHGDPTTGQPPTVYWTFPTEVSATDPNASLSEDGGVAETPVSYNLTSAVVANVGGTDYLYVGASNGRVYCLEMTGRGDGSTRRRWTYPDDFRPDAPTTQAVPSGLGSISGSVTIATVGAATAVIVPTTAGKILALDALGSATSKTTTLLWQYPPATTLGPIVQTPAYDATNGKIYFAAPNASTPTQGIAYALNTVDGSLAWSRTTQSDNTTPFADFSSASTCFITNAETGIGDTAYFFDANGFFYGLNTTDGTVRWQTQTGVVGADAGLTFTYMRAFDPSGLSVTDFPAVLVATRDGKYLGYYASGATNVSGTNLAWNEYSTKVTGQVASFATGGYPNSTTGLHSHLYIGDPQGNFLAFSAEDDSNTAPPVSQGDIPIEVGFEDGDPTGALMAEFKVADHYKLYAPNDFFTAQAKGVNGTLTAPDIALGNEVTRTNFEMGDTLYLVLRDLPDPSVVGGAYGVQATFGQGSLGSSFGTGYLNLFSYMDAGVPKMAGFYPIAITPTGNFIPGAANVSLRVTRLTGGGAVTFGLPNIQVANPFAIEFNTPGVGMTRNTAGYTIDPSAASVQGNDPMAIDTTINPTGGPTDHYFKTTWSAAETYEPGGYLGNDLNSLGDGITHGAISTTNFNVYDRSLMVLLNGAGLNGVRLATGDLTWQPVTAPTSWPADSGTTYGMPFVVDPSGDLGVYNPLNIGSNKSLWKYGAFEDYPFQRPNVSRDYPDVSRTNVAASAVINGLTYVPTSQPVQLQPPTITATDLANYKVKANYQAGQLTRAFIPTTMSLNVAVPKYQPANVTDPSGAFVNDYRSRQTIYLDDNGSLSTGHIERTFAVGARVAPDEQMTTTTSVVDLGTVPGGTGFGDATGAVQPFASGSVFSPSNAAEFNTANPLFATLSVYNAGNANLPNVRIAKAFNDSVGNRSPLDLFSATMHDLATFDGQYNLYTDLDPNYSIPGQYLGSAFNTVPAQKPRPGDVAPLRMSRNPIARPNSSIGTTGGPLAPTTTSGWDTGDIRVGVAVPLGAPVGSYSRKIYAFQDTKTSGSSPAEAVASQPTLTADARYTSGQTEPFLQDGVTLNFTVQESRLTNSFSTKSSPMLDNLLAGTEAYAWENKEPSAIRDDTGRLLVAFGSDRRDTSTGLPEWVPPTKTAADFSVTQGAHVYVATTTGATPPAISGPASDHSPAADLNATIPTITSILGSPSNRWFGNDLILPDPTYTLTDVATKVFRLNGTSDTVAPDVVKFTGATFSTSSLDNSLDDTSGTNHVAASSPYLAYLAEATKLSTNLGPSPLRSVILTRLDLATSPVTEVSGAGTKYPILVPGDSQSVKTRPSVAQVGNGAAVFYTSTTNGSSDIMGAYFTGNFDTINPAHPPIWGGLQRLSLRDEFESVGAPSVLWRPSSASVNGRFDVLFTGKVRGRSGSEAFMAHADPTALISGTDSTLPLIPFGQRFDDLVPDSSNTTYWAPGMQWQLDEADIQNLNIFYYPSSGATPQNLIDPNTLVGGSTAGVTKAYIDRDTGQITADVLTLGGKVYIDTRAGSVRFSGTVIPSKSKLVVGYNPRVLRVSSDSDANYRGVSAVFDQRLVGIRSNLNLTSDLNYTYTGPGDIQATAATPARYDRMYMAFDRSSTKGTDRTRPYMATMRFGVKLPYPVFVGTAGPGGISITVDASGPLGFSGSYTYQVDPNSGQIYFPVEMEGVTLNKITYTPSINSAAGTPVVINLPVVTLLTERSEAAVPIQQPANESDIWLALDPQNTAFNPLDPTIRRPPLVWMFWTSTRAGGPDVYFQTVAPRLSPNLPGN